MNPDIINGCFEFAGAFVVLNHIRVLLKERAVAGVSVLSTFLFNLWGMWNVFYYPYLGQTVSFYGGLSLAIINAYYVYLLMRFKYFLR